MIGRAAGTVRIANDDAGPALSVSDASIIEGDSGTPFFKFSVALSTPALDNTAVAYRVNHTTTNGGDIQVKTGIATIAAGKIERVDPDQDLRRHRDRGDEFFTVTLSDPVNAALADPVGLGTIINDDPGTGTRLGIGDAAINEGNAGQRRLQFTVSLSKPAASAVKFSYTTGGGTATPGRDYSAKSGTITIAAGSTSAVVAINVKGNAVPAANTTFGITLSNPSAGVTFVRATGTGTIRNDD